MSQPESLHSALLRMRQECPQILGAVLATGEGLILAALGELASDAAAASAVHLAEEVDRCLGLLTADAGTEMLVWSASGVWCLTRLDGDCVLMARAGGDCRAGALKLAVDNLRRELAPSMAGLDAE